MKTNTTKKEINRLEKQSKDLYSDIVILRAIAKLESESGNMQKSYNICNEIQVLEKSYRKVCYDLTVIQWLRSGGSLSDVTSFDEVEKNFTV